jgi:acetyl-CoA carboxylase biotin carboxyl carrier protein
MAMPLRQEASPAAETPKEAKKTLNIDTGLIETLAELLQRTGLTEIEVNEGDTRIRVAKQPAPVNASYPAMAVAGAVPAQQAIPQASDAAAGKAADSDHPGAVRAPMVGTAYLTPEPGADPFVTVGGEIKEGQTLLIVEAMKVMNPIRAPRSGRIAKILVTNGDPVEFDELLLIID